MSRPMLRLVVCALIMATCIVAAPAAAQQSGLPFLREGDDAAALGVAGARAATARGAFALSWNPAGLAVPGANALGVSHQTLLGDQRRFAASARFAGGTRSGLGLYLTALDAGDLEARSRPGASEGTFSLQHAALGAGYARAFGPVRAGIAAKWISERIFDEQATGWALDLGLQTALLDGRLALGAALRNLGEMSELDVERTPMPLQLRAGAAAQVLTLADADGDGILSVEASAEVLAALEDDDLHGLFGLAGTLFDVLVVRAGLVTGDPTRDVTLGAGVRRAGFAFDYAVLPYSDGFGGPGHVFSLGYAW